MIEDLANINTRFIELPEKNEAIPSYPMSVWKFSLHMCTLKNYLVCARYLDVWLTLYSFLNALFGLKFRNGGFKFK